MYAFQKGSGLALNRGHIRIALAALAVLTLTFVLFHLNNTGVTIDSLKYYQQSQADQQAQADQPNHGEGSGSHQPQQQEQQSWYKSILGQLQQKQYCKWEFTHYEPSEYEKRWFSIISTAQNDICSTVQQPEHAENSKKIVRRIESLLNVDPALKWAEYDTVSPAEPDPDDHLFSRMHYRRTCYDPKLDAFRPAAAGRGVQLIEPLWGMLRDPFDPYCGAQRLAMAGWDSRNEGQSKEAIMPMGFAPYTYDLKATSPIERDDHGKKQQWRPHGIPPWHSHLTPSQDPRDGGRTVFERPQNIFMDLGSSYFGAWGGPNHPGEATSAASGKYFYETYHARGQPFSKYLAVEVAQLDPNYAQTQLPPELVGIYNLINTPLTMDDGDKLNTVDIIKRISKPGDFFVLKVDIDSAPIEMPLIQSLLDDDPAKGGASGNIDELMFEHRKLSSFLCHPLSCQTDYTSCSHVSLSLSIDVFYSPMIVHWGALTPEKDGDLAYSYEVFRDLRKKGIRSHSWP